MKYFLCLILLSSNSLFSAGLSSPKFPQGAIVDVLFESTQKPGVVYIRLQENASPQVPKLKMLARINFLTNTQDLISLVEALTSKISGIDTQNFEVTEESIERLDGRKLIAHCFVDGNGQKRVCYYLNGKTNQIELVVHYSEQGLLLKAEQYGVKSPNLKIASPLRLQSSELPAGVFLNTDGQSLNLSDIENDLRIFSVNLVSYLVSHSKNK
jgi:hypothetical protein